MQIEPPEEFNLEEFNIEEKETIGIYIELQRLLYGFDIAMEVIE